MTCRHVASALSRHPQFYLRANTYGTQSLTFPHAAVEWAFHPDKTVDLAAALLALPRHTFDVIYFRLRPENAILGPVQTARVFCGEPVSLIGLFRLHPGKERNISFVHTGNIAVLPDPKEKIPIRDRITGELIEAEVYLVEAQTLDGLSGSPAFMHEIVELPQVILEKSPEGNIHPKAIGVVRLLGLYSGSWDGEPGTILAADRNLHSNQIRVPVGVGTVVPADRIVELIRDHPLMKKKREEWISAVKLQRAASQDSAIPPVPEPLTGDANPKHREDFNSLLGAAVKTRESKD